MNIDQKLTLIAGILDESSLPIGRSLDWYLRQTGDTQESAEFFQSFRSWPLDSQLRFIAGKQKDSIKENKWSPKVIELCEKVAELQRQVNQEKEDNQAQAYLNLLFDDAETPEQKLAKSLETALQGN